MLSRSFWLLLASLAVACGGKTDVFTDGGGGGDGGGTDGGGTDGGPGPDCPASPPQLGAACGHQGVQCEYGGDPRWTCNEVASCASGKWDYMMSENPWCPTGDNSPDCPATYAEAQAGGACSVTGTSCNYSEPGATRFCSCVEFGPILLDGGPPGNWMCSAVQPGCPPERPRLGQACSQPSLSCSYDSCGVPDGLSVECSAQTGTWVIGPSAICASAN
jgi:hypothetical protein